MSTDGQSQDFAAPSAPETGSFIDLKTRSAQQMNGSPNCIGTNLSDLGSTILNLSKQDDVTLVIYEKGIWIPKQ